MQSDQLCHKILFPIDFSISSLEAISYVVGLAQTFNADLILLYTFRLTEGINSEGAREKKRRLELDAFDQFKIIDDRYLKASGIKYFFQYEVGFAIDRIITNVKEHAIDLLIIPRSMLEKEHMVNHASIINDIDCPVMLLPTLIDLNSGKF